MHTHLSCWAAWRRVHTGPANTIPSCLICPKAIIKLLACTASCLSLVIDFYKYSSRVTLSQTPTFKKTISPPVTLFSGTTSYKWLSLDFVASYFMFSTLNINLYKNKSQECARWLLLNTRLLCRDAGRGGTRACRTRQLRQVILNFLRLHRCGWRKKQGFSDLLLFGRRSPSPTPDINTWEHDVHSCHLFCRLSFSITHPLLKRHFPG